MRGFTYVGYIRRIELGETKEYFTLYRRGLKVHMFVTNDKKESTEKVRVFDTTKEVEEYVNSDKNLRAFLSWCR